MDFLGEIGGLLGFFVNLFGALLRWLAKSKISSLIANRFYTEPKKFDNSSKKVKIGATLDLNTSTSSF